MTSKSTAQVVVVGVDGSPDSHAAIQWAQQYAEAAGATLQIVVSWEWPQSYGYPVCVDGFDPEADAQRVAEKAVADLSLPADRIHTLVHEGSAGPVLVDASAKADLLVVGSHGHGVVSSMLLGSVSTYCVHHAATSVVVVR